MRKFSIPEGTRDLILGECSMKKELRNRIETVFDSYGFTEIVTPSIEYYQTYHTGFDTLKDEQMYKFFDHNGAILTLRMDMTVPIARVVATKFKDQKPPFRFQYCANVYKVKETFAGKRSEVSDCGVELIGLRDKESDLEVLCLALEVMETMKQDSYTLEIGNVNFFHRACQDLNLADEEIMRLADLIDRKSMSELKTYLETLTLSEQYQAFFLELPWLCGDVNILKTAQEYCFNDHLKGILSDLQTLADQLIALGYAKRITFDLGKVSRLNYYSGLLFEGFVEGCGSCVLSGGRYDQLLAKFGRSLPAIGFSVKLDYVLGVLKHTTPTKETRTLRYPIIKQMEALQLATSMREQYHVRLLPMDCEDIQIVREEQA